MLSFKLIKLPSEREIEKNKGRHELVYSRSQEDLTQYQLPLSHKIFGISNAPMNHIRFSCYDTYCVLGINVASAYYRRPNLIRQIHLECQFMDWRIRGEGRHPGYTLTFSHMCRICTQSYSTTLTTVSNELIHLQVYLGPAMLCTAAGSRGAFI